ncbi:MAG: hypothetical protein P4N59_09975 [Negativicutes bacterium]|nr:hypothetical protein [Negativicutes bacterium]
MPNTTHESLAAEAIAYLRESAGAVGGFNGVQQEIIRQANCLYHWAEERGLILTDAFWAGSDKFDDTREHHVYLRPDRRIIKCTKPGRFGLGHGAGGRYGNHCDATPLFYLQRLELMNQEFPTDLRFEGMALGTSEYENDGRLYPYIITSQRFIEAADNNKSHPNEEEIEDFMRQLGFSLVQETTTSWVRESDLLVVTDTKMLNFIISDNGIIPIDLIIGRKP